MDLLIGYTGFVGLNLIMHMKPNTLFVNSKNASEILDREFDTVYCCGVYAEKWKANKYPEDDTKHINGIIENLSRIKCKRFILISTVDVLNCNSHQYENLEGNSYYATLDYSTHTYGVNRRRLEEWCLNRFPECYICRLPALFGHGLKKNALWDMINNNNIDKLRGHWRFQWYNLDWLYDDIQDMLENNKYKLVHLVTSPIRLDSIQKLFFPRLQLSDRQDIVVNYNIGSTTYKKRSIEDIFVCMKGFIDKLQINSRLLVSELAWKLEDDRLMAPWLKSRGLANTEAVPSKDNWNMDKYTKIYSAQSILYGEQIQIFKEKERFMSILESKLQLLESKATHLIIFGSPLQRIYNGEETIEYFREVGDLCKKYNIIFCLENNSSKYGCNWMMTIKDAIKFVKEVNHSHVKVNLDTGSMIMENEDYDINHSNIHYISHVQISFPNLSGWNETYTPILKKVINELHVNSYSGKISLEIKGSEVLPFNSISSFLDLMNTS
jgi:nucleoside-diphosphate-sugar epimerase